ncbi:hypothetical protein SAMN05661044_01778 [Olivibacter domesticus]|uniref:Uncharacterized protein n=1 Tax=Olivibacter domesticus TaxID=407022 RepID=A0A1H7LUW3_OLID1|nr:hypothetical protein SAMN05661044_01778 [Olivibacter domesticus]
MYILTMKLALRLMRTLFFFYKQIFPLNFLFSLCFTLLGIYLIQDLLLIFIVNFTTFGYALSLFYFELMRKPVYYFYYNLGYSKMHLFGFGALANLLIAIFLYIGNSIFF